MKYNGHIFQWTFTGNTCLNYGRLESPHFQFYGSDTCVYRILKRTDSSEYVKFGFRSLIPEGKFVFYRASMIEDTGKECFISKGQLFSHTDNIFLIISYQDYFLPQIQNRLDFCFEWFENEESCVSTKDSIPTESPINITQCSIKTEVISPVPTRDNSTNQESPINITQCSIKTEVISPVPTRDNSTNQEESDNIEESICAKVVTQVFSPSDISTNTGESDNIEESTCTKELTQVFPLSDISTDTGESNDIEESSCAKEVTHAFPLSDISNNTESLNEIHDLAIQNDAIQSLPSTCTGSPIQICERATQANEIQSLLARNSSTQTESFIQCCDRGIQADVIPPLITRDSSTCTESSFVFHESATQTEGIQWVPSKDIRDISTNTDNSINMHESATQTEIIKPWILEFTSTSGGSSFGRDDPIVTEEEQNTLMNILSDQLSDFYEMKVNTDCVLRVGEFQFPVHRSILSARSEVFAAMFFHNTSESESGIVDIRHADAIVVDNVIYYIYTSKIRGLSPYTAVSMYEMADKYALFELREKCLNFLKQNITLQNVCDAAQLAHVHAEMELEEIIIQFINMRFEELLKIDNWKRFCAEHQKLSNDLICSAFITSKTRK